MNNYNIINDIIVYYISLIKHDNKYFYDIVSLLNNNNNINNNVSLLNINSNLNINNIYYLYNLTNSCIDKLITFINNNINDYNNNNILILYIDKIINHIITINNKIEYYDNKFNNNNNNYINKIYNALCCFRNNDLNSDLTIYLHHKEELLLLNNIYKKLILHYNVNIELMLYSKYNDIINFLSTSNELYDVQCSICMMYMPIIIDPFIHNNIKCKSPPICIYCINTKKISKCLYNCGALLTENSFKHNFLLTSKIDIFLNKYINMFKNIFNEELNIFLCFKCNSKFDKLQLLYDHIVYYLNNKKCIKKNNICKECNWRTINIINNVHDNNSKIFYHKHLCSRCNIKNNL